MGLENLIFLRTKIEKYHGAMVKFQSVGQVRPV